MKRCGSSCSTSLEGSRSSCRSCGTAAAPGRSWGGARSGCGPRAGPREARSRYPLAGGARPTGAGEVATYGTYGRAGDATSSAGRGAAGCKVGRGRLAGRAASPGPGRTAAVRTAVEGTAPGALRNWRHSWQFGRRFSEKPEDRWRHFCKNALESAERCTAWPQGPVQDSPQAARASSRRCTFQSVTRSGAGSASEAGASCSALALAGADSGADRAGPASEESPTRRPARELSAVSGTVKAG